MRLVWIISKEIEIASSNVFLIFGHFKIYFYLNRKCSATWRYLLTTLLFEIASHHIRAWHCLILNLGWKKNSTTSQGPRMTTYQGELLISSFTTPNYHHTGPEWPPIKENYLSNGRRLPSHLRIWNFYSSPLTHFVVCWFFFLFFPKVIISQYVPTCL